MPVPSRTAIAVLLSILGATLALGAQKPPPAPAPESPEQLRSTYVLGPEDQIAIRALDAEEISDKPLRIDLSGYIRLPMAGRLGASGLTIEQLEAQLVERLKTFIRESEVPVSITEFRSQPVSVIGAVKNPGVHQLQGRKTLIEILSLAGGLDRAASPQNSRILRPSPNASNRTELAVDLKKVLAGKAQDLPLQARGHPLCPG
jgi:polysaccharide export outer membrane protein